MDILASDWSNSSSWSRSQHSKEEQDIVPFLEPDNNHSTDHNKAQAVFSHASRSPSGSNQTAVMITDESGITGTSSFGQSSNKHAPEATCCNLTSNPPLTEQHVRFAEEQLRNSNAVNSTQDDTASDFSRSTSSNWSHDEVCKSANGPSKMHLAELIGRGAFGSVYKGSWKGKPAAIKASKTTKSID